jgi:hypothetical protein
MTDPRAEIQKIEEDIRRLEELKQSGALPPDLADVSIEGLKIKRATYQAELQGDGAIAQGDGAKAVGKGGILVEGSFQGNIYVGEQPENDEQVKPQSVGDNKIAPTWVRFYCTLRAKLRIRVESGNRLYPLHPLPPFFLLQGRG